MVRWSWVSIRNDLDELEYNFVKKDHSNIDERFTNQWNPFVSTNNTSLNIIWTKSLMMHNEQLIPTKNTDDPVIQISQNTQRGELSDENRITVP